MTSRDCVLTPTYKGLATKQARSEYSGRMSHSKFMAVRVLPGETNFPGWQTFKEHLQLELENIWLNPADENLAVYRPNDLYPNKNLEDRFSVQLFEEMETPSIIVQVTDQSSFGLQDKLRLLFHWRKNGGSQVSKITRIKDRNDAFELLFGNGWGAVMDVCKHKWTLDDQVLKVAPYFSSFQSKNEAGNQPLPSPTASNNCISNKLEQSSNKGKQVSSSHPKVPIGNLYLDRTKRDYLRSFANPLYQSVERHSFASKDMTQVGKLLKQLDNNKYSMPIPGVVEFLCGEGDHIKRNIEHDHKCLFIDSFEETKKENFLVTLLVTIPISNAHVHLVQGNARYIKTENSLHFDLSHDGNQASGGKHGGSKRTILVNQNNLDDDFIKEFENLSKKKIDTNYTLALSFGSELKKLLSFDNLADMIIKLLDNFFGGNCNVHIFLCEMDNCALLEAYKYTLMTFNQIEYFGKIDEGTWKLVSPKNFPTNEFNCLKNKVKVMETLPHESRMNSKKGIFLPILQNLDPSSCPYKNLNLKNFKSIESAIKFLQHNMSEEKFSNFCVGSAHILIEGAISIALYCTQDWDVNVAQSIEHSMNSCLKAFPEIADVFIYPPGMNGKYPVDFTVQKCLKALAKKTEAFSKFNSINLVVPDKTMRESFEEVLNRFSRTYWNSGNSTLTTDSSFTIFGKAKDCTNAKDSLQKLLYERMKGNTLEKKTDEQTCDALKKRLHAFQPDTVCVTIEKKKVIVKGLTRTVVSEFYSQYKDCFPEPKPQSSKRYPKANHHSSKPKRETYKWSRMHRHEDRSYPDVHFDFDENVSDHLEGHFQQCSGDDVHLDFGIVKFSHMTLKGKSGELFLLRNENMKDLPLLKSGTTPALEKQPQPDISLEKFIVCESFFIDDEQLYKRFEKKRNSQKYEYQKLFWIRLNPHFCDYLHRYGLQKLFIHECSGNMYKFCKDPAFLVSKNSDSFDEIFLLQCHVLQDNAFIKADYGGGFLSVQCTKLSDAQILPKTLFIVKMKT